MAKNKPKLLSGGNPQIPKGYGDAPVQAYLNSMHGPLTATLNADAACSWIDGAFSRGSFSTP